jgi:cysteine desulfurase/selenocysteine lyase
VSEGPLFDPRDFMIADGIAHLCAGGESACLRRHAIAFSRYLRDKSNGMDGRVAQEAQIARARAGIARSWGVDAASIGFVANVAEGVSIVAESLDWQSKRRRAHDPADAAELRSSPLRPAQGIQHTADR